MHRTFPNTRLRRLRRTDSVRRLVAENNLQVSHLIQPLVAVDADSAQETITGMPDFFRLGADELLRKCEQLCKLQIPAIALFPYMPAEKRNETAELAWDENGLVQRRVRAIKQEFGDELLVITDVALDPYTSHGHDGLLHQSGDVANDATLDCLNKQALSLAQAGADIVAPSDMMDGRVKTIRETLESAGYTDTIILSYAAKYASSFYGPYREAIGSTLKAPKVASGTGAVGNAKSGYQMDYRNTDEALHEVRLDIDEGADIVMVKPALPYIDIVSRIKAEFQIPVFAFQVSGEYSMLKHSIMSGTLSEQVVVECVNSVVRAGADAVLTYFAEELASHIKQNR